MQDAPAHLLSVVIPMYRESSRIVPTLKDVIATLRTSPWSSEIILVDDGSTDDTVATVRPYVSERGEGGIERIALVKFDRNRGKGAAVRAGLAEARGDWRLMMDADNAARVDEVSKLFQHANGDTGLVAGSRSAEGAIVEAQGFRKLTGLIFKCALLVLGLRLAKDTQCGFKLYRADVAEAIAAHGVEDRFAFDLEHLLLTRKLGTRVCEVGIRWQHVDGSQVSPVADGIKMLYQAACIRFRKYGELSLPLSAGMAPNATPAVGGAEG
ncbi:MAG: dolichyl-phosphate beta-glucosyltransferase [Planctomycetota bacterium]